MIKSFFARYIFEPIHIRLYRRDNSLENYKEYKNKQWDSLENNQNILRKRLYDILKYSIEQIPFYKNLAQKENIIVSREYIFEVIRKFPIMTKALLKNEFQNLHNLNDNSRWFYDYSGGSTGEPTKVIQDKGYNEHSSAINK